LCGFLGCCVSPIWRLKEKDEEKNKQELL
jgi:hypothetical protein